LTASHPGSTCTLSLILRRPLPGRLLPLSLIPGSPLPGGPLPGGPLPGRPIPLSLLPRRPLAGRLLPLSLLPGGALLASAFSLEPFALLYFLNFCISSSYLLQLLFTKTADCLRETLQTIGMIQLRRRSVCRFDLFL